MTCEILFLCGSYHRRSMNRAVLDAIGESLLSIDGVHVRESIGLDSLPSLSADLLEPAPPLVEELRALVSRSDGVVIAGPEYAGGVAGSLKNALDWCVGSTVGFYGKPVAIVSAGTSGGPNAIHQLARTLLWQGAHLVGALGVAGPGSKSDRFGKLVDETTLASVEVLAKKLVSAVSMDAAERVLLSNEQAIRLGIDEYPHAPRA